MAKDLNIAVQGIRERHLNIVYFIDSAKSHSIRINLTAARWLLAISIGVVLWSLLSIAWILNLGWTLDQSRGHLTTALKNLFQYQVKYEGIFEEAYPEESTQSYFSAESQSEINNPVKEPLAKPDIETLPDYEESGLSSKPTVAVKDMPKSVDATAKTKPVTTENQQNSALSIGISNAAVVAGNGKMELVFDIANREENHRAEGYIWAEATIKLNDGTLKKIVAPAHAKVGSDGSVESFTSTYKFSIQRFKRKDFSFLVPNDETWKLAEVQVTYVDVTGEQSKTETINAPFKFKSSRISRQSSGKGEVLEGDPKENPENVDPSE
jgi:hypothetical protein